MRGGRDTKQVVGITTREDENGQIVNYLDRKLYRYNMRYHIIIALFHLPVDLGKFIIALFHLPVDLGKFWATGSPLYVWGRLIR